jgi:hypothetical protein
MLLNFSSTSVENTEKNENLYFLNRAHRKASYIIQKKIFPLKIHRKVSMIKIYLPISKVLMKSFVIIKVLISFFSKQIQISSAT